MKSFLRAFLVFIMVSGLALAGTMHVSAEAPGVIVIVGSDTTWTKADSPHNLTGPLLVSEGATLTIEAGATVNINNYGIRVNGALRAIGSSVEKIHFNDSREIEFTQYSNGWNEQTGSGSIIENAILSSSTISSSVSLKLDNNILGGIHVGDSSIISNNGIGGSVAAGSSNVISNNSIGGDITAQNAVISNNNITGYVSAEDSTISNNEIRNGITGISLIITNNTVTTLVLLAHINMELLQLLSKGENL